MAECSGDVTIPRGVRLACEALAALGVGVRPELLVSSAAVVAGQPGGSPLGAGAGGGSGEGEAGSAIDAELPAAQTPPSPAPMELWKALHDLVIAAIFLRRGVRLPPHALAAAWREISRGGPHAVRFDAIRAMIQVKMRDFGYGHALPPTCTAADLLCAFCWLVAQCEVLHRHVNACCRDAVRGTPLLSVKGSQKWAAAAPSSNGASTGENDPSAAESISTPMPCADAATHHVSAECGLLWHAARELATAEERRTLLLRRLCALQVPLRPRSSRLLTPTELEAQLRNDDPAMRVLLDARISNVKSARDACAGAVAFGAWCTQNVPPPPSSSLSSSAASSVGLAAPYRASAGAAMTAQEELAGLGVDELIRGTFGLDVRKPRAERYTAAIK
jgi:hypothetical protein